MTIIVKESYQAIINSLQLGNPVAEYDSILQEARVDTPVFEGVLNDKFDIVTGRKGAGKTAIFKILGTMLQHYYRYTYRTVILSGVNSAGEPIFNKFKDDFSKFSEEDFENFWKIYFIVLIYNDFINEPSFSPELTAYRSEIEKFKKSCRKAGIPDVPAKLGREEIIQWVLGKLAHFKRAKVSIAGPNAANAQLFEASVEVEMPDTQPSDEKRLVIYVNSISDALQELLVQCGYKVWIILDRLDEVFERYTIIEFNGLRGLLRAYKSFEVKDLNPKYEGLLRIKIFLRDDIKEFLTDEGAFKKYYPKKDIPPLVAATHIFAKESPTLSWTPEQIEQLILYRLLQSDELKKFLGIWVKDRDDLQEKLRSRETRTECWNKIFPERIANSTSLAWIYTMLKDSNGVVTPRSVIDMLTAATEFQKKNLQINFEDSPYIFTAEALKDGVAAASKNKLEKDIFNEFPKDQKNIKKLGEFGKNKLTKNDLQYLYGDNWESTAETLRKIGILRLIKHSNDYMVEFLFRPALGITYKYR